MQRERVFRLLLPSCLLVIMAACAGRAGEAPNPELVLGEGVRLTAKTATGNVSILAGKGLARTYAWNSCSLSADMRARPTRWFGSLGIYDPASSFGFLSHIFPWWFKCEGVSRTVVQEGQIHFADRATAENWILRYAKGDATVWSNDGLLVKWGLNEPREQINVDVWQICVSGNRPTELPGAQDQSLVLSPKIDSGPARRDCASVDAEVARSTQRDWKAFWQEIDNWPKRP